jgi:outer membrane receptor protein involved in Fe transport
MHIGKILLLALLCAVSTLSYAQNFGSVRGTIRTGAGEPALSLTVKVKNTPLVTVSDNSGAFLIGNVAAGSYILEVTGIGYKPTQRAFSVLPGKETTVALTVAETSVDMDEVTVVGRTEAQEVARQPYNVTAVDATKLYNTTLNLADALDRVAGVRVRESGGVGSNFNLSLNGFSGNQVRYFIDGIPMEGFGSSFQINNIPINTAERIEVYKGVVPIWLGSDALGGAINIVTGDRLRNYVDASYSYGSFNTHRSTVNMAVTSKSGLTFQLNAFQNYSDNSYRTKVDAADINTGAYAPAAYLRRFNDTYHNETVIASVGVVGKRYADKLLLGVTMGKSYQEIQTGARLVAVFGAWHRRGTLLMPTLKYRKENLLPGLDVTVNANFNFGTEQNIDTVGGRYDWYGNFKRLSSSGSERERSLYKYRNNNGVATAMANYRLGDHQALALSSVFNTFDRQGSDVLFPNRIDPARKSQKNVLGLGYTYNVKDVWSVSVFGKNYLQRNVVSSQTRPAVSRFGYGIAGTYFVLPNLQLKTSYELTNRLPDAEQIFGDVVNREGNANLMPERSNNFNVGANYVLALSPDDRLTVNANGVYRNSFDFIYDRLNQNQGKLVSDNRDGVWTLGADTEVRYSHKNRFSAGATVTYQYLRSTQKYERDPLNPTGPRLTGVSTSYLSQMPNIPYLFGNADASLSLPNLGGKGNSLTIAYNLLAVNPFWLVWPNLGGRNPDSEKREVPLQISHDLNVVYSLKDGRYNVGVECRNLTDVLLYDNFSLQKPGRGLYLNLRYFISKTSNQ